MKILTVDVETTISNKGHWADQSNKLMMVGVRWLNGYNYLHYVDDYNPVDKIQEEIDSADILVGFNFKFDLHWLRRYGISFRNKRVWDCQLAEFLLENQQNPYPSLNQACEKYGIPLKLDVVKTEYWDKGIDTDQIPINILSEYLDGDLDRTEQVFLRQREEFKKRHPNLYKLFQLQCKDLLVLQEMEHNGIKFNTTEARKHAEGLDSKMVDLYNKLSTLCGNVPLNCNSNDHLSALLYGGCIAESITVPCGVYKTGQRAGQIKYKKEEIKHILPRLVNPLDRTETAKSKKLREEGKTNEESLWEVNADVLAKLKAKGKAKEVIEIIQEYSKLEKLKNTYLIGWSDLIDKMNWPKDMIHGTLNQCVAATGRLSSNQPNLQNADKLTKMFCESRYHDEGRYI